MLVLYFDCFSGASGDMILGALIDAGVPFEDVRRALGSLAIADDAVRVDRVGRAGIMATKFTVRGEDGDLDHAHDHRHGGGDDHSHAAARHDYGLDSLELAPVTDRPDRPHRHPHDEPGHPHETRHEHRGAGIPHEHGHRTLAEIYRLIEGSALSATGKDRAKHLFHRLGEAEGGVHGTPPEQVHLHEVGAVDSIIDIVGTVFALEQLRPARIVSSPLNVGGGTVRSAHGLYPVPAPATIRLLAEAPIYSGAVRTELVTPTGALLITDYASAFGPLPPMRVKAVGYGAGSKDFVDTPNVLRVMLGEADATAPAHAVAVIEADIDDMNPQIFGMVMDRLLAEGALDVFYTAIQMKKNRPGTLLTIVAAPEARERLTGIVFRETTTIGVRYREMARECLDRETVSVDTPLGVIRMKVARRNGELMNVSPEFDDCVRLATAHGRPLKDVQALASRAYFERTNATG